MLLHEKLKSYRLILASHSPRRQQLLRDCGLAYLPADKYEVEERYPATLPAAEVPLYLCGLKSDAYPVPLGPHDILITADFVKFAKFAPDADQNETVYTDAYYFIEETKAVEVEQPAAEIEPIKTEEKKEDDA